MTRLRRLDSLLGAVVCASCASPPPPAQPAAAPVTTITFEADAPTVASAKLPYAPTRNSASDYSWRRVPKTACVVPTHLRFDGSHGEFPLLPEAPEPVAPEALGTTTREAAREAQEPRSPDQVIASLRPRFRHCFSSWLDHGIAGEASVRFAVELACSGEVDAVNAKSSGVDESTVACLFGVVARAEFDPPAAGQNVLQVPVVFKNTDR